MPPVPLFVFARSFFASAVTMDGPTGPPRPVKPWHVAQPAVTMSSCPRVRLSATSDCAPSVIDVEDDVTGVAADDAGGTDCTG